ncbi:hypothetical protein ACFPYI_22075 [Halomarina salina]|uniref:Yip1 domain-containing protein n=1 Tax=Halomarina salina TaxID=1872699 RepID=A0ABD5RU75_9EURY|nr:hypothetical protein [Halomarina salina]
MSSSSLALAVYLQSSSFTGYQSVETGVLVAALGAGLFSLVTTALFVLPQLEIEKGIVGAVAVAAFFALVLFGFAFVPAVLFCTMGLMTPLALWLVVAGGYTIHGWSLPGEGQTLVGFVVVVPVILAVLLVAGGIEYGVRVWLNLAPPSVPFL